MCADGKRRRDLELLGVETIEAHGAENQAWHWEIWTSNPHVSKIKSFVFTCVCICVRIYMPIISRFYNY